ncbi:class I SAM-dependent methyltransferase [Thauera linaloolentis]|uniref:Ubiquinone/menaquinone biosynthesis C-methyltransferase UbiE n=1 Tax=Thauera linaloolentis (strain DSM 12138 / JCM 21573 / CCUG 41526 / CIP 105981 / IAM 15112 / NBRC 102519 / 47Lol) TaxID=1123367 RepID=N6Z5F3_THAL4|nr:class I SAM-dependent methyltransferase [Thauera linaloolentis]ENO89653.1 ubiquinone/menaquinone biosynthesis methyltransferase UbiE [Thauera linaloolentis 47Lol = DSM 12138]MCM8567133.1 class I SAM-dependent methyltransferase [Thauera linaloolentis]
MTPETPASASFGGTAVSPGERRRRIRGVFEAIAPRYDLMNDLMSFGIHRLWKRTLARRCEDYRGIVVDLAGGTGDMAARLCAEGRTVIVCDPSWAMMSVGRRRGIPAVWSAGEAERLPFASASVDLLTLSFGLRNTTEIGAALAEIHRVLKPGGCFACLEFSRPAWWLAPVYDRYSRLVIPRLGAAVAGRPEAYTYLIESIRRFPDQQALAATLSATGFQSVHWENLSFGIACIHYARRSP